MRPSEPLAQVRALYDTGHYLQAWSRAQSLGDMAKWEDPEAKVLASRLAGQLGGPRRAVLLGLRAYRRAPGHPEVRVLHALRALELRGPLVALRSLNMPFPGPMEASAELLAEWHLVRSAAHRHLLHFDAAQADLQRAEALAPSSPWVHVERAMVAVASDRLDEAVARARRALEVRRLYRPGLQVLAHALMKSSRVDEAHALLSDAAPRLESAFLWISLGKVQRELGRHREALHSFDTAAAHAPLMDKDFLSHLAREAAPAASLCGEADRAVALARMARTPQFDAIAERLERSPDRSARVLLPVLHVAQAQLTCVPATIASLGSLWSVPLDQAEIARAICYAGTPGHRAREWAAKSGWTARAFTVDWDIARALLDRGVAFALSTSGAGYAHMVAIGGYDPVHRTLLARDPSSPWLVEIDVEALALRQADSGPTGTLFMPLAEAHRIHGLPLPDAREHGLSDAIDDALARHDRQDAAALLRTLDQQAPGHWLTLVSTQLIHRYDRDVDRAHALARTLAERFPKATAPLLEEVCLHGPLLGRTGRLARLAELARAHRDTPELERAHADELRADARERPLADFLLRRFTRCRPWSAAGFLSLADLRWSQARHDEGLEHYRQALCLEVRNESLAQSYFHAARFLAKEEEALAVLRSRVAMLGEASAQPAVTLVVALELLHRDGEIVEVLSAAQALHPGDAELDLFVVGHLGRTTRWEEARDRLERTRGRVRAADWSRAAAQLALLAGNPGAALSHWREVSRLEPRAADAHRGIAQRLEELEGPAAARAHWQEAVERHPNQAELLEGLAVALAESDRRAQEHALRRLLELDPVHAWGRRELALLLGADGREEEALSELGRAHEVEDSAEVWTVASTVLLRAKRRAQAREALRNALRRRGDADYIFGRLSSCCGDTGEKRVELEWAAAELAKRGFPEEALLPWQQAASGCLEPDVCVAFLERARAARPDAWEAQVAVLRQRRDGRSASEAERLARALVERFPGLAGSWLELALTLGGDPSRVEEEGKAFEEAVRRSPFWNRAAGGLAEWHLRRGDPAAARACLEAALVGAPNDVGLRARFAQVSWTSGAREEALARMEDILRATPDYEWGWETLGSWSAEVGAADRVVGLARALTEACPWQVRPWTVLANAAPAVVPVEERLRAVGEALRLEPALDDAKDLLPMLLCEAGRHQEAVKACADEDGERAPLFLRGRAAWIEAERGNLPAAVAAMDALVAESPDYLWGHSRLIVWNEGLKDGDAARRAALALGRAATRSAAVQIEAGEALQRLNAHSEARDSFLRALELSPGDRYTLVSLFDVELALGNLGSAAAWLAPLSPEDPFVAARQVQLCAQLSAWADAEKALPHALFAGESNPWPANAAAEALRGTSPGRRILDRQLGAAVERPETPSVVGALFGRHAAAWFLFFLAWSPLRRLMATGSPAGVRAVTAYLEELAESGRTIALGLFILFHRALLRAQLALWGTVGYAYLTGEELGATHRWLSDWRARTGALPWMLHNVVCVCMRIGEWDEANAALEAALALPPDHVRGALAALGSFEAALRGDGERSQTLAEEARALGSDGLWPLCLELLTILQCGSLAEARQRLDALPQTAPYSGTEMGRTLRRRVEWSLHSRLG